VSTALLFPGQGAQRVGMAKDLAEAFPAARAGSGRVGNSPLRCNRSVDFPAPLGPTIPKISPRRSVKRTSSSARRPFG
jgi:hypothetical protein